MKTKRFFVVGLALAFSVMAQEPTEKIEPLNLDVAGDGAVTNQVVVETGLTEETEAPMTLQKDELKKERDTPPVESKEEASSTNTAANAKTSFLLDTGIQYAEEGDYKDAERAYLRALEEDPNNESIQFRLSTLYIQTERFAEGVDLLEALVAEHPENSRVRNNLAWAYATGKGVRNNKKALRHAREAILSSPTSPSMWNTLAEAYYMAGDYERALRSSEHAIDLLTQRNPEADELPSFEAQRTKIQRAAKALRMLDGLDEDE